jgi:hypothetical protein
MRIGSGWGYLVAVVLEAYRQAKQSITNHSPDVRTPKDIVTANSLDLLVDVGDIVA